MGATSRRSSLDLERLAIHSETVYYAALRRYLALVDIEQGDATVADLWHVTRGAAWAQWFGERELDRAAAEAGREVERTRHGDGWRSAESGLAGANAGRRRRRVRWPRCTGRWPETRCGCVARSAWHPDEIASFADFVAFVRLRRLRRSLA